MPKLKLTYFDFDGGRGEPARLALHIGGIAFEDHRIAGKDWPAFRDKTPFLAIPTLEVDGTVVSQSNSINRYVGKLAGLYPADDVQALLCDEGDGRGRGHQHQDRADHRLARRRQEEGARGARGGSAHALPSAVPGVAAGGRGGEYFADRRLTVADLKVAMLIRWLRAGVLDHIPKDLVDTVSRSW